MQPLVLLSFRAILSQKSNFTHLLRHCLQPERNMTNLCSNNFHIFYHILTVCLEPLFKHDILLNNCDTWMPGGPDDYAVGGSVSEVQRGDVTTVRFPWMGYGLRENKPCSFQDVSSIEPRAETCSVVIECMFDQFDHILLCALSQVYHKYTTWWNSHLSGMVQSQSYLVSKPWKEMEGVGSTSERLGVSKVQDSQHGRQMAAWNSSGCSRHVERLRGDSGNGETMESANCWCMRYHEGHEPMNQNETTDMIIWNCADTAASCMQWSLCWHDFCQIAKIFVTERSSGGIVTLRILPVKALQQNLQALQDICALMLKPPTFPSQYKLRHVEACWGVMRPYETSSLQGLLFCPDREIACENAPGNMVLTWTVLDLNSNLLGRRCLLPKFNNKLRVAVPFATQSYSKPKSKGSFLPGPAIPASTLPGSFAKLLGWLGFCQSLSLGKLQLEIKWPSQLRPAKTLEIGLAAYLAKASPCCTARSLLAALCFGSGAMSWQWPHAFVKLWDFQQRQLGLGCIAIRA